MADSAKSFGLGILALATLLSAPRPTSAAEVTLPAGTVLPIRLESTLSSASSRPEDRVVAVVREDVRRGGRVVIPAGSEVVGHVTSVRRSGKVKGRAYLAVRFSEVRTAGRGYRIATAPLAQQAPKTHGRDAKIIGGGLGAGALVGALVDGKEGAAKGGLLGGAAGGGVVLTTRGQEVTFPAGARYRLRLTRALTIS